MKTNKLIAAALLPLLFSCAKENIEPSNTTESKGDYITVNLVPGDDAVTRATFDDDKGITWTEGDYYAGIVNASDNIESQALDNVYEWNGNMQASFKFKKADLSEESGRYILYYPYHFYAAYSDGSYKIPQYVGAVQKSGIGLSSESLAVISKEAITLTPYEQTEFDNNGADVSFKVVGSYIRLLVYGGDKEGEQIDYIRIHDLKGENWVAGTYYVSVSVDEENNSTIQLGDGYGDLCNEIILNFDEKPETKIEREAAKGIYAQVRSGKHQLAYEIHTKVGDTKYAYIFKSSQETDFAFGSIKDIPLNIAKATATIEDLPEELYIVGNVSFVGWNHSYAIKMDKNGYIFKKDVYLNTRVKTDGAYSDAEGFKFLLQNTSFEPAYVNGGDNTLAYYNGDDADKDIKFKVDKSGYYTVTADFSTGKVTCTPAAPEQFYIWGSATKAEWNSENAISLDRDENDNFVFTKKGIELKKGEYKFFSDNHEMTAYVNDGNGYLVFYDSPSDTDEDRKFQIAYEGTYDLTVNLRDNTVKCILTTIPQARTKTGQWTNMDKTDEPGVFIAKARWIASGDNNHDIQIKCGDSQYVNSGDYEMITFESREKSLDGIVVKDVKANDNSEYSWWIHNDWCKVRYDIIFDSNKNTVTFKYVPGKVFWLVGHVNNWTVKDESYKAEVGDNGIASWELNAPGPYYSDGSTEIYGTDIKICGESLYENVWDSGGEWYYSSGKDSNNIDVSAGGTFGVEPFNSDYKWYLLYGSYHIEFNTHTFELTVEKKN